MPDYRSDNKAKLEAPRVPGVLENIPDGEPDLVPASVLLRPVKVLFQLWQHSLPSVEFPESVRMYVDGSEVAYKEWTVAPIASSDLFVEIPVDKLLNKQGARVLHYEALSWSGNPLEPLRSEPLTITIDTLAPTLASGSQLIFPAEVSPPLAITAAYLADPTNADQVLATLPDYPEKKVGDVLVWYWERSPGGREVAGTKILEQGDLTQRVRLPFKGDLLRLANGEYYASYRVSDRAGNVSVLAREQKLNVNIRPPTPRKFPTVREATSTPLGTGSLNPFAGRAGVTVLVPAAEVDPTDTVTVDFIGLGGETGVGTITGVEPIASGGLAFAIPAAIVAANIPVAGDGRKVEVRYLASGDVQHSATYTLSINELSGEAFGALECDKAQTGSPATLSKATVAQSGAMLQIAQWAYHQPAQQINVWATDDAGARTDLLREQPTPIPLNGKFSTSLPKDYVATLALNSMFTVHASVSFDNGYSYRPFRSMTMKVVT